MTIKRMLIGLFASGALLLAMPGQASAAICVNGVNATTTTTPPPGCTTGLRMNLGLWEFQGNRPPFPAPAGPCEAIIAHGDLDDTGTCSVQVFAQGQAISGLGSGTFSS